MKTRSFGKTAHKFRALQSLAVQVMTSPDIAGIVSAVQTLESSGLFKGKGWSVALGKISAFLADPALTPRFTVYAEGNGKLPFYAFSTLPGVTCPGAGDCLAYCYSFRAWRYPSAYFRQLQNAVLLRFNPAALDSALSDIVQSNPQGFDFRLYVDGDFSSSYDVELWFDTLKKYPMIRAYGYSKSFELILGYAGDYPSNYRLNISGGHNATPDIVQRVESLPITRGHFVAVSIGRKVTSKDFGTKPVNDALRAFAAPSKVFPCPGKCGDCTGAGHACGSDRFKGIPIAIAIH